MIYTDENIMVRPFNTEKLNAFLQNYFSLNSGEEFLFDKDSLYLSNNKPMLIDNECCAGFLEKEFNKASKKIELVVKIGIRRSKTDSLGETLFPMNFECYFPIFETDWIINDLLDNEMNLKEFMGSRYRYNPRIITNTHRVVKAINQNSRR